MAEHTSPSVLLRSSLTVRELIIPAFKINENETDLLLIYIYIYSNPKNNDNNPFADPEHKHYTTTHHNDVV